MMLDEQQEREIATEYKKRLDEHIDAVREAGRRLGVNEYQLLIHDDSKKTKEEFMPYAIHFCGGGAPDLFAGAWLHHIHHNPHHWQHWIFPDGFVPKGAERVELGGVVKMPDHYALEMVADWMGASKVYTGSWDMAAWLKDNMPKIILHSETGAYVRGVLESLGYTDLPEWGRLA